MRKSFLALLAIILALLAASPLLVGMFYKQRYLQIINIINNEMSKHITVTEYHLGWLSSTIKGTLGSEDISVNFENEVMHGPVIYDTKEHRIKLGIALMHGKIFAAPINTLLGIPADRGLIETNTFTKFDGFLNPGFTLHFTVLPGKFAPMPGMNVNWKEIDGAMHFAIANNHITQVTNMLKSNGFEAQMGDVQISSSGFDFENTSKPTAMPEVWELASSNTVSHFSYKEANKLLYAFDTLNVLGQSSLETEQKNLYKSLVNVTLNKGYISDIEVDPASLHIMISGINAEALSKLIQNKNQASTMSEDAMVGLVTPSSKILGDLSVASSKGNVTGYFEVSCPIDNSAKHMGDLIAKINAHASLRMTPEFANYVLANYGQIIFGLLQAQPAAGESPLDTCLRVGCLKKDNDMYVMDIVGSNNSVKLNGVEVMSPPVPPAPSLSPTNSLPDAPRLPSPAPTILPQPIPSASSAPISR